MSACDLVRIGQNWAVCNIPPWTRTEATRMEKDCRAESSCWTQLKAEPFAAGAECTAGHREVPADMICAYDHVAKYLNRSEARGPTNMNSSLAPPPKPPPPPPPSTPRGALTGRPAPPLARNRILLRC